MIRALFARTALALTLTVAAPALQVLAQSPEPAWTDEELRAITAGARVLQQQSLAEIEAAPFLPERSGGGLLLLLSASQPPGELREAFALASEDQTLTLVFRGLRPGETLKHMVLRLRQLAAGLEPVPRIAINPGTFRTYAVDDVPSLVDPATGHVLRGSLAPERFRRLQDEAPPDQRDLGRDGPTATVVEPDLADIIKARVSALDLESRARDAHQRFWQRVALVELPQADRDRVRLLDPTLTTATALTDHEGTVILPAEAALNPLDHLPLISRLVIFNPERAVERRWAKAQQARHPALIFLAAGADRAGGWEAWHRLQDELDAPVYLLPHTLADRLALEATPTLVEADGNRLRLTETHLPDDGAQADAAP